MHAQAGAALTSTMPPPCLPGLQHGIADDVDAADVEADRLGGGDGAGSEFGMDVVGDVGGGAAGGQVGVVAQDDPGAAGRDRFGGVALGGEGGPGRSRRSGSWSARWRGLRPGGGRH